MTSRLGFWESVSIGVGMALATSCFVVAAGMVRHVGGGAVGAVGASALLVLVIARSIGEQAQRMPSAIGIRTYTKVAFGDLASLHGVFLYLYLMMVVAAVEGNIYAQTVRQVVPDAHPVAVIAAIFAVVAAINAFGLEFSRRAQLVMVALMFAGLCLLSLVACLTPPPPGAAPPPEPHPGPGNWGQALVAGFFLFAGFEWVTSAMTARRDAARQVPRVLWVSVLLLAALYGVFAFALHRHADLLSTRDAAAPQMALAARLWGPLGMFVTLAICTLAVLTTFGAGLLGASRLLYYLAREGRLPRLLAQASPTSGAPLASIATIMILAFAAALFVHLDDDLATPASVAGVLVCLCYAGLLAAGLRTRPGGHSIGIAAAEVLAMLLMLLLVAAISVESAGTGHTLALAAPLVIASAAAGIAQRLSRQPAAKGNQLTEGTQS